MERTLELHNLDSNKVFKFEKYLPYVSDSDDSDNSDNSDMVEVHEKICMLADNNEYHKYLGYNKFSEDKYQLTDDWISFDQQILNKYNKKSEPKINFDEYKKKKLDSWHKIVLSSICNPENNEMFNDSDIIDLKTLHPGYDEYTTLNNYFLGYKVFISETAKRIIVYGKTSKIVPYNTFNNEELINRKILDVNYIELHLGESEFNDLTYFSGAYGDKFKGNSILVLIEENEDSYKYMYIGAKIYNFITQEKIMEFVSSVGNNSITYAYAESENWCYDMSRFNKSKIECNQNRKALGYLPNVWPEEKDGNIGFAIVLLDDQIYLNMEYSPLENNNQVRIM